MSKFERCLYGTILFMVISGIKIPISIYKFIGGLYLSLGIMLILTVIIVVFIYNNNKDVFDKRNGVSTLLPNIKSMVVNKDGNVITYTAIFKVTIVFIFSMVVYANLPKLLSILFK